MDVSTQKSLTYIQNELRALKTSTPLNFGALNLTDNTPQASWSGHVNNSNNDVVARWVATFTRTDGIDEAPYVDFGYDFGFAVWHYDDNMRQGSGYPISATGRDLHAIDELRVLDGPYATGSNWAQWAIEFPFSWYYNASNGTDVTITVQAIAMAPGTLKLERVI